MENNDSSVIILSLCFVLFFCFALLYPGCPQCALLPAAIAVYICCLTLQCTVADCLCTLSYLWTCWCCGGFKGEYKWKSGIYCQKF